MNVSSCYWTVLYCYCNIFQALFSWLHCSLIGQTGPLHCALHAFFKTFLLQASIKTFPRHWGNWIEYGGFFKFSISQIVGEKKCYDGLGLVWSGDKCVSFRGRRIKQERAAARWMVRRRGDRSAFDRRWDEIEMNSGIVGEENSQTLRVDLSFPTSYISFNVLHWSHGTRTHSSPHTLMSVWSKQRATLMQALRYGASNWLRRFLSLNSN